MSAKTALLEIGVETLPARFLKPTLEALEAKTRAALTEARLSFEGVETYGTPLRLAVVVTGLPVKSAAQELEISGPPAKLLKDASGAFTPQAAGFAKKNGVEPEDLTVVVLPKGEFLCVKKSLPGEPAAEVLARVWASVVSSLEFPKSMVWEESRMRFARPIRSLCALLGGVVVKFSVAGVASGRKIRGLAATGAKALTLKSPEEYLKRLRNECVLADTAQRREALLKTLADAAKKARGTVDEDEDLIEKTVCLTEHPVAVLGHFDEAHLALPAKLLSTVLKTQLMYFPVLGKDGELTADFIGVRDGLSTGQKLVQTGFERVLKARLSDASFFFGRDLKIKLEDRLPKLERVGFQKGLGSLGDKTARVSVLAEWMGNELLQDKVVDMAAVRSASGLCYADLLTGVVGEFPELQGIMGGVYARHEDLGERTALALEEFHLPTSANGPIPSVLESCLVSMAGKLDTICAMFSGGFLPSGSEDPFALRRMGNGVIRMLLERQIPLSLPKAVAKSLDLAGQFPARTFDKAKVQAEVLEFMWSRLESLAVERNFPIDEVRAVKDGALESVARTFSRLAAVHALRPEPDFVPLAAAFKRASNILKQADGGASGEVEKDLLREAAEQNLFSALCRVEGEVREKVSQGLYEDGLRQLVALKPQVDQFFEGVMVMDKDDKVKANRISLLSRLVRLFKTVADIGTIQN